MSGRLCCVLGCDSKGAKMFHFPRPVEKALKWRNFCQNEKLNRVPLEKLHDCYFICIKHFDVPSFTYPSSEHLLRSAIPTLFPPSGPAEAVPSEQGPPTAANEAGGLGSPQVSSDERYKQWADVMGCPFDNDQEKRRAVYLCGLHFNRNQFHNEYRHTLTYKAVPTITRQELDGGSVAVTSQSSGAGASSGSSRHMAEARYHLERKTRCAVSGCDEKIPDTILHRFPRDTMRAIQWRQKCANPELNELSPERLFVLASVCTNHFSRQQYTDDSQMRLVGWSTPDINLPVPNDPNVVEAVEVPRLDSGDENPLVRLEGCPDVIIPTRQGAEDLLQLFSSPDTNLWDVNSETEGQETELKEKSFATVSKSLNECRTNETAATGKTVEACDKQGVELMPQQIVMSVRDVCFPVQNKQGLEMDSGTNQIAEQCKRVDKASDGSVHNSHHVSSHTSSTVPPASCQL